MSLLNDTRAADPAFLIGEAKRLAHIIEATEDQTIHKALNVVRSFMRNSNTCARKGKSLSKEDLVINHHLENVCLALVELLNDDIPF